MKASERSRSTRRRSDVAAIDSEYRAGGLFGVRQGDECPGYVLGRNLPLQQIVAGEIFGDTYPACRGAPLQKIVVV